MHTLSPHTSAALTPEEALDFVQETARLPNTRGRDGAVPAPQSENRGPPPEQAETAEL
jgi:hypothetical protein